MIIDFQQEKPLSRYHLLTQTVIPRPIAWVLSENQDDSEHRFNLAPFSFFNAVCSNPPLLAMSVGKKPDGQRKDTYRNLTSGRDFVIHIAPASHAQAVANSAATLAYGESELHGTDLALTEFTGCPLPRLQDAPIAYHCKLYDTHDLGPSQQAMIYAEIIQLYINDKAVVKTDTRYMINPEIINPLARLGGNAYANMGEVFTVKRPD